MNKSVKRSIQTKTEVTVDRFILLEAISTYMQLQIPSDADVTIRVPGGGDWSGELLDVNSENPVVIKWEERTNE